MSAWRWMPVSARAAGAVPAWRRGVHAAAADRHQQDAPLTTRCTLIPGDGVGPEITDSVRTVFAAAAVPVQFEHYALSEAGGGDSGPPLGEAVESIRRNGVCLKGQLLAAQDGRPATLNMRLRTALDLYANVVHVKTLPGVGARHAGIDATIIREQTEGEYSALEHESVRGVVESLKIVTAAKCERIAKFAFDYATKNRRKKVTAVHKANIMKLADGLFLESCARMSGLYPRVRFQRMIVDNCAMQMVSNPQQFDVMVTTNLYGNILDNVAVGLAGGAGLVAGASYSRECAVFEPGAKHAYTRAAGMDVANPTAMLLCAVKMLAHINHKVHADRIKEAVMKVLLDGKVRTRDLGGRATTTEFTQAVVHSLQ